VKFVDKHKKLLMLAMGVAIFVVTLISLYHGKITWVWEGVTGCAIATLMVWIPEELSKLILSIIKKLTTKLLGNNGQGKDPETL